MRRVQRIGNLNGEAKEQFKFHRPARDPVLQGHAIQKLHGDEGAPVLFADFVDGADVRMIQRRSRSGFAPETFQCLRVASDFVGQELERDKAARRGVFGLVDHAHAAAAELFDDAVVRDRLADHWRESYVCKTGKSMKVNGVGQCVQSIAVARSRISLITPVETCIGG